VLLSDKFQLFRSYSVHLAGVFAPPSPSRSELSSLVELGGGHILKALPSFVSSVNELLSETRQHTLVICDAASTTVGKYVANI
jgi:hypothetical protein